MMTGYVRGRETVYESGGVAGRGWLGGGGFMTVGSSCGQGLSCTRGRDAVCVKAKGLHVVKSYLELGLHLEQKLQDSHLHLWNQVTHIVPCSINYVLLPCCLLPTTCCLLPEAY